MRISAGVEVSNRNLPSLNISNRRPLRSYLSLGLMPGKNEIPYLLHQTQQNAIGVKYKLRGNVDNIFARFIEEGKATVRFISPPHDLIIKSSSVAELKQFLKVLRCLLSDSFSKDSIKEKLSNLGAVPKKVPPKPKTKMVITSKCDLPTLEGFPRTLNYLQISDIGMKRLDSRVLRLQGLRVLNLSRNDLESLPPTLDLLPSLTELYLPGNRLGTAAEWDWAKGKSLGNRLSLLDLSDNQILYFPKHVLKLRNLKCLLLNNNHIKRLPCSIWLLSQLQRLEVSSNQLEWLPWVVWKMRLVSIDVSQNPGCSGRITSNPSPSNQDPPQLLNISASVVLQQRWVGALGWGEGDLPSTILSYLEAGWICQCGRGVFPPPLLPRLSRYSNAILGQLATYGPNQLAYADSICSVSCPFRASCSFST